MAGERLVARLVLSSLHKWQDFRPGRKTGRIPRLVQAARKEGEIVWYTTMSSDQSNAFMARFQQKYSLPKAIGHSVSGGSALLNRVLTEAKAGKNFFDVVHGTGEIVLPLMDMGLLVAVHVARA